MERAPRPKSTRNPVDPNESTRQLPLPDPKRPRISPQRPDPLTEQVRREIEENESDRNSAYRWRR